MAEEEIPVGFARQIMLLSGIALLAGTYLAISPLISGYTFSSGLTSLNVALGAGIVILAYFRATIGQAAAWLAWANVGLGVLTLVTPWTTNYAFLDVFRSQHLVVGGIVVGCETLGALLTHLYLARRAAV